MFATRKINSVVGLDVDTGSVAATEVRVNGTARVTGTAIERLDPGVVGDGEVRDPEALAAALRSLFSRNKLGKEVRIGVANQRVVMRTLRLPIIEDAEELETAVRFQAQDQIPMPLEQAVIDYEVVSRQTGPEGEKQMDVMVVAARRDMVQSVSTTLRKAGLRPIGIDLAAFGMIRALRPAPANGAPEGEEPTNTLYCYLGDLTNLAVARGDVCAFTRIAPFGTESIAARVSERLEVPLYEARECMLDVGLEEPIDVDDSGSEAEVVRDALGDGASKLVDELRISMDFYGAQEGAPPIERVVVCGPGAMIPGLPDRINEGLGLGIESRQPDALGHLDEEDAARLTISYGLALSE